MNQNSFISILFLGILLIPHINGISPIQGCWELIIYFVIFILHTIFFLFIRFVGLYSVLSLFYLFICLFVWLFDWLFDCLFDWLYWLFCCFAASDSASEQSTSSQIIATSWWSHWLGHSTRYSISSSSSCCFAYTNKQNKTKIFSFFARIKNRKWNRLLFDTTNPFRL